VTITVTYNGSTVTGISWLTTTPWSAQPKITEHEIDGADFDIIYHRGMKSASCTVTGYCRRTSANAATLERLKRGGRVAVSNTATGESGSGICTSLSTAVMKGGLFLTVSMTVVEQ